MRKSILLLFFLPFALIAQDDFNQILQKGNLMVGGDVSLSSFRFQEVASDLDHHHIALNTEIAIFSKNGFARGIKLGYSFSDSDLENNQILIAGPFLRAYKGLGEYRWAFYWELDVAYVHIRAVRPYEELLNGGSAAVAIGVSEFLTPNLSWDIGVGYRRAFFKEQKQIGQISLNFGIQIFINRVEE